jgi:hypothetical protein
MSIAALNWAWSQNCRNPTSKLVLLALADKANEDGECWPGMDSVAEMAGVSSRQVSTHLARLEEAGLIVRKRRRSALGRLGRYVFHLQLSTGRGLPVDHRKPTSGSTPPLEADFQWKPDAVTTGSPASSATGSLLPVKDQPPRSNHQEATTKRDAEQAKVQEAFDAFWEIYPPTNGRKPEKGMAEVAWRKLTWDQRDRALIGARHLAASDHMPKYARRFLRRDTAGAFPFDDWQTPPAPARQSSYDDGSNSHLDRFDPSAWLDESPDTGGSR